MKSRLLFCCSVWMLALSAQASIIYSATSGYVPDANPAGWSATATASGFSGTISDVSVNLHISGGYNGDLYAFLSYGGVLVPLLNRVGVTSGDGFGYGETGFNVTLSSSGANDVHFYGNHSPSFNVSGQLEGTWQPDGRAIDPQSNPSDFDSASRVTFGSLNGQDPNGTWTLFIADLSVGEQSQLLNWELNFTTEITAVPEPVNGALAVFGSVLGLAGLSRKLRAKASA